MITINRMNNETPPITATYDKIWKQKFMGNLVPISYVQIAQQSISITDSVRY